MKKLLLCIWLWIPFSMQGQTFSMEGRIDSLYYRQRVDSLVEVLGVNKTIPEAYQLQVLLALSYYEELDSVKIIVKEKNIRTTLNTRPTLGSMFSKTKTYVIRVQADRCHPAALHRVSFNGCVGVFGHELSHIIDYESRSFFGIIKRGVDYMSKRRKSKFEKEIDNQTIAHGLGWQLYDWSYYVLHGSDATEKYKRFKRETYLTPEEIKRKIEVHTASDQDEKR